MLALQLSVVITTLLVYSKAVSIGSFENNELDFWSTDTRFNLNMRKNTDICKDFYLVNCSSSINLPDYKFYDNVKKAFSDLKKDFINLLNEETETTFQSSSIEQQLFQSCMNLENDVDKKDDDITTFINTEIENEYNRNEKNSEVINENSNTWNLISPIFNYILKKFNHKMYGAYTWQQFDEKFASFGFDHIFFKINVISDPKVPNKNIISLEPPSIKEWNVRDVTNTMLDIFMTLQVLTTEFCNKKMESINENEFVDNNLKLEETESNILISLLQMNPEMENDSAFLESEENISKTKYDTDTLRAEKKNTKKVINPLCEPYMDKTTSEITENILNVADTKVTNLYNFILWALFNYPDDDDDTNYNYSSVRLSIEQWNETYKKFVRRDIAKIDWIKLLKKEFERLDIPIDGQEDIIIKNPLYFISLAKFLGRFSHDVIVHAIKTQFVVENMKYLSWNWGHPVKSKSTFCLEETKLYGISEELLKDLNNRLTSHTNTAENIIERVIKVIDSNITNTFGLTDERKANLNAKLKAITRNVLTDNRDTTFISNYYKDLKLTGDYLIDINNYKIVLKTQMYRRLRHISSSVQIDSPFSINEIENPRNRFILVALLGIMSSETTFALSSINKEAYYATYGVNIAKFLYSLLHEEELENDLIYRDAFEWLIPRATYSPVVVKCFLSEDDIKFDYSLVYKTITEIFGLRFAYEAMINDIEINDVENFFTVYTQTGCEEHNKLVINKALAKLLEGFDCPEYWNQYSKCGLNAFES